LCGGDGIRDSTARFKEQAVKHARITGIAAAVKEPGLVE
jgi:hypothetical protein